MTRWILVMAAAATMAWATEPTPDAYGVYVPGPEVNAPKLVHAVPAPYPSDSALAGAKHICILIVVIGEDGIPKSIQLANAIGTIQLANAIESPFDGPAIAAVQQSEFKPGTLHSRPVPVRIQMLVPFLSKNTPAVPEFYSLQHLSAPVPMHTPQAKVPDAAKAKRISDGNAFVQGIVDENGNFQYAHVVQSSDVVFEASALEAVSQYRFKPAMKYGVPIPVRLTIRVDFR